MSYFGFDKPNQKSHAALFVSGENLRFSSSHERIAGALGTILKNRMGITLHLGIADDFPSDTKHGGKSFFNEVLSATSSNYLNLNNFLNKEEQTLLYPEYDNDESLDKYRKINPKQLKEIFEKVFDHLKSNHDHYPLVHWIYNNEQKLSGRGTSDNFHYKGYKCHLDGFHNNISHRQEIRISNLNNGWETLEWVKANPTITLEGKSFFIRTENKYEQFKNILEELIDICEEAIKTNQQLLWIFSN